MKIHLSLIRCRYCEHANPADAKFCGACGGELHLPPHLTSCPHCGAVNSANATACIWCHRPFPERKAGAPVPSSPVAEVSRSLPRRVIAGAVVLAAIGALGYYGYRQALPDDAVKPAPASSEAADANSAKADGTGSASGNPLATTARAAANPPRAGREPVESQEGKAPASAIARSQTRPSEPGPSRQEACTEAIAALGLCATQAEAGKGGGQGPSRGPGCTAEAAALGLCAPGTTQRRE